MKCFIVLLNWFTFYAVTKIQQNIVSIINSINDIIFLYFCIERSLLNCSKVGIQSGIVPLTKINK